MYPDDSSAVENFKSMRIVLHNFINHGKFFRYHVKASKSQLIVKNEKFNEAVKVFKNTKNEMKKWGQSTWFCHRIRD